MSTRVNELATRFEAINDEIIDKVTSCNDAQWKQVTASEQWSVGVVAHHVAVVNRAFDGIVQKLAAGETYSPDPSMDRVHKSNAEHAREYANVGKDEVLEKLRASGAALASSVREIDEARLDQVAGVFGGNELSVAQVVEYVVIGHPADHLNSLRATLPG